MNAPARAATPRRVALVGNPNTGKSTLFNGLTTGHRAHVSNLTGTTVETLVGPWALGSRTVDCVDVPGTYSLAGRSPEEWVAARAVLGIGDDPPDVCVAIADAGRLERSLYLVLQLLELGVPTVVAVNLLDEAASEGISVDLASVERDLGVPVVGIGARSRTGLGALADAVERVLADPSVGRSGPRPPWTDAHRADMARVLAVLPGDLARFGEPMARLAVLSLDDPEADPDPRLPADAVRAVVAELTAAGRDPTLEIVQTAYTWLDAHAPVWRTLPVSAAPSWSSRVDRLLLHPIGGSLAFLAVMSLVFTALFSWADPLVGLVEDAFSAIGGAVGGLFGADPGPGLALLRDLLVDGVIGGVGSILVFLPQIAMLFFFIGVLEDSGYLSRAAHLMDRLLRLAGLPGRAFVPLLSGYACAVPAIMATRAMPRFRDRLLTMMVIPLTSCSARLPVYALVIAALFPATLPGFPLPVQPVALMGMYLLSTVVTVIAAVVLGRTVLAEAPSAELIELVPYRMPSARVVLGSTWRNAAHFVQEAGGVILVATIVLWALLTFPRVDPETLITPEVTASAAELGVEPLQVAEGLALEQSFGGRIGHAMEPVIRPLGFDWKIGVGVLGAFAAREVFVSTMGLVYGIGDDVDEESASLRAKIASERRPDGTRVWTPLVGMSLMVFFAFAMQCTSTLAVLVKETRGVRWPAFVFAYMTVLAWCASFVVYQGGRLLGFE